MSKELDFRNRTWGTADGRRVRLKEMEIGHLVNVLNWVHDHEGIYPESIKEDLIREADYRRIFAFAECDYYAGLVEGRWQVIDPRTGEGSILPPPESYIEAVEDNDTYQRMSKQVQQKRKKQGVTKG
ncbi:hypothetical protein [Flavobacterium sp.]|jgi:hypothetical protein|uniref:hypothetical protein n=1 Tax=Flavobacterium sp. TaxID=239 RepID=UPI0037C0D65B